MWYIYFMQTVNLMSVVTYVYLFYVYSSIYVVKSTRKQGNNEWTLLETMLSFNSHRIQSGFNIFRIVSRVKMHKKYFRIVIVQFQHHYKNEKSLTMKCKLVNCE